MTAAVRLRAFARRCHDAVGRHARRPSVIRLGRLVRSLDRHDALLGASAMAFDAFLGLIPLLAFGGWVMHRLHQRGDIVVGPLLRNAPLVVAKLADGEMTRLSDEGAVALAPLSVLAFLWVSSAGVATAMSVCERIFHSKPRRWWVRRLIAIGGVLGALASIAAAATAGITLVSALGAVGSHIVAVVLPGAVVGGLVAAFYATAIVWPTGVRRKTLPGTALTLTLWSAVSSTFSFYVEKLARFSTLYGGLAVVAILLVWLWLLALALLVGAELNADLDALHDAPMTPEDG